MRRLLILLGLSLLTGLAAVEGYRERLAQTDRSSPDELCALAKWCREHRMHTTASRHFQEALKINPDHEPTRHALGFLWDGERWRHKSRLPQQPTVAGEEGGGNGQGRPEAVAAGPAPGVDDIQWDPTLPPNPDEEGVISGFLDRYVARLRQSQDLDLYRSVLPTLVQEKYRAVSVSRIAHAFNEGGGTRLLQGTCQFIFQMRLADRRENTTENMQLCQRLLPFMAQAASRTKDTKALSAFASVVGAFGDKRVMPLLLKLLEEGDERAAFSARGAIASLTMIPEDDVTLEKAKAWWDRYHGVSNKQVFGDALDNPDPMVRLTACMRLYPYQDKRIVDTIADLIASDSVNLAMGAARLLKRICGSDWSVSADLSQEKRQEIAENIRSWWEDERAGYTFVEFRGAAAGDSAVSARVNLVEQWVDQLGDPDIKVSEQAKAMLRAQGMRAAEWLVRGLNGGSGQKRQACRDLLRVLAREDFGFDAFGDDDEANAEAIAAWKRWLEEQRDAEAEGPAEETPDADTTGEGGRTTESAVP